MKNLLICSPWDNAWVRYYKKFFKNKYNVSVYYNDVGFHRREDLEMMIKEYQAIDWADIVLFGWTDPFLEYWSNHPKGKGKRYVAFLRSYELFNTSVPWVVDWKNVDHLIFCNTVIRTTFEKNVEHLIKTKFETPTHFIPNAIDLEEWKFVDRKPNDKITWISGLNYKKGVQLLMQFAKAMPEEYRVFPVGNTPDLRSSVYCEYLKEEFGIKNKLLPSEYHKDLQEFLKDKSFELMTSLIEGHPNALLESMAVGMKPLIHNFPGSKNLFPEKYIWNTIDEAMEMLKKDNYNSAEYRDFIEKSYDMNKVYPLIEALF